MQQDPRQLFASAETEHRDPVPGRVLVGEVPDWIDGSLIRNGPGLYEVGDTSYRHFFDGLAMLQKFSISGGSVSYTNQFLRSDTYQANMAKRRIVVSEFGTAAYDDPCKSLLGRFASHFFPSEEEAKYRRLETDNTIVNVFPIGDQIYAATETPRLNRIDPRSLDRVQQVDFGKFVAVNTVTAHPHVDEDGSVLNLGSTFDDKAGPQYVIVRIPKGEMDKAEVVAKIPARWRWHPAYYHSFGVTENYLVFVESPLAVRILRLLAAMKFGGTFGESLKWYTSEDCLFHVYSKRDGSHVQTFKSAPFFTFHHMNAFERVDGEIIVDLSAYDSGDVVHRLWLQELRQLERLPEHLYSVQLRRYHLKLGTDQPVTFTTPADGHVALEFPQINYRFNARPYRYGYGVGIFKDSESFSNSQVMKVDWETGKVLTWQDEGCEPSEAVFVERPGASAEDDGVLLASVIRIADKRSLFLLILDAASLKEVARVAIDGVSVPRDIHGTFFKEELLRRVNAAATS